MADEKTPRDAQAREFLDATKRLLPEFQKAADDLKRAGEKAKTDPAPTRPPGRPVTETPPSAPEIDKGTEALRRQSAEQANNVRLASDKLRIIKQQADALTRGVERQRSGTEVFPTGRTPWMAGGRPITGDVTDIGRSFDQMRIAAGEAKDAILSEQRLRQRLSAVGAPGLATPLQQIGGGGIVVPGGGGGGGAPSGLIIPSVLRTRPQTLGQEIAQESRLAALAAERAADEEASAAALQRQLASLANAQRLAENLNALEAQRLQRQRLAAAVPGLAPGERGQTIRDLNYMGGAPKRYPGLPISYVNQGEAFRNRVDEAEFGAHRGGRTAARDIAATTAELNRLGVVQAEASQQMRRHGALTTEFLTALARGETTLQEFGFHASATALKFAGWTAAAAGVYGLLGAFTRLKTGAQEGSSGVHQLDRVIDDLDPQKAQDAFTSLSREFNVPIETAVDAVFRMGQRFHQLPDAVEAARASLYSFKVGEVDVATSTQNLLAITRGFGLGADQMAGVFDKINAAQNEFGVRIPDTEAGLAKAAGAARNAGVDFDFLLGIMIATTQATGRPGTEVGTAIARGINESRKPINRDLLKSMGVDATDNFQTTLQSALKVAQQPGVDLNRLAKGLFGGQYARIIAPVLRDQRLLNQALGPDFQKAVKDSAAIELEKVLKQVDERIDEVGNSLERIGNALAQSGLLAPLSIMLDSLNGILHVTESLLTAFGHLPAPIRAAAGAALGFMAMRRVANTAIGEGLAEFTRIDALGPSQGVRDRRQAIIGVRHAEQTASNQFEGAINQSAILQSQANAERRLAQQLNLEAAAATTVAKRATLQEQSIAAQARFDSLAAQSAEMERLALSYQSQYVTAREARVALQKREITAEAALAAGSAANVLPAIGAAREGGIAAVVTRRGASAAEHAEAIAMNARHDAMLADRARMERARLSQVRPGGPIPGDLDRWARDNAAGAYPSRAGLAGASERIDLGTIDTAAIRREAEQTRRGIGATGVGRFGRQAGTALKGLGTELKGFVGGLGPIGLGFAALTVGQLFFDSVKRSQEQVTEAMAKNERAAHSVDELDAQITRAQNDIQHGPQHNLGYRILDNIVHPFGNTNARAIDEADRRSIEMRESIKRARERTAGSNLQNVGQTNREILRAADVDVNNITKLGLTREEFYANFERYAKNLGVSMEALITGKVDPKVQAALDDIKARGEQLLGAKSGDPFAQFRDASLDANVTYLNDLGNRGALFGVNTDDADTVIRGVAYVTQKYGHSNKPEDIEKVAQANAALDKLLENITTDLQLGLDRIARMGSDVDVSAGTAGAQAQRYVSKQSGFTDSFYGRAIDELERQKAMVTGSMGKASGQLNHAQSKVESLVDLRDGDDFIARATFATEHARKRGAKGMVDIDKEIDMAIREARRELTQAKKAFDESEEAKNRRIAKIQRKIDEMEQQRFDQKISDIDVTAAYQKSIASDESDQAAIDVDAAGKKVQAAIAYHGPKRWQKILEALTAQNEAIAAQAQQNIGDVQSASELRTSAIIGAGRSFDRRRLQSELSGARDVLATAQRQKDWPGKKRAVEDAQKAVNGVLQQIAEFNQQDAKEAEDLARRLWESQQAVQLAGITDPVGRLRKQVSIDRGSFKRIKRSNYDTDAEYQIARNEQRAKTIEDEIALRSGIIDDDYQTAQFQHEMGQLSDDAYIRELQRIKNMKGISKQMKRQLLLEIHRATEEQAGDLELNVGGIKLPTIYEIRRAMGGRSQRMGAYTTIHNNPTVHLTVADSSDLPATAEMLENVVGGPVKANLRAAGLIG